MTSAGVIGGMWLGLRGHALVPVSHTLCTVSTVEPFISSTHHGHHPLVTIVCAHVGGGGGGEDLVAVFAVEECGRPVGNTFQILHSLRDNFSTGLLRSYN